MDMKPDFRFGRFRWRTQERLQLAPNDPQRIIVLKECGIHLGKALEHVGLGGQDFVLLDEGPHHIDTHFYGLQAIEDVGRHQRAVLGEGEWAGAGEFEAVEVVTICDHPGFFRSGKWEQEIRWKPGAFGGGWHRPLVRGTPQPRDHTSGSLRRARLSKSTVSR